MQASTGTRQAQGLAEPLSTLQSVLEKTPGITGESLQRYVQCSFAYPQKILFIDLDSSDII